MVLEMGNPTKNMHARIWLMHRLADMKKEAMQQGTVVLSNGMLLERKTYVEDKITVHIKA